METDTSYGATCQRLTGLLAATRSQESAPGGNNSEGIMIKDFFLQNSEKIEFYVLSLVICGNLF
jgi:hypothetical protein